MTNLKENKVKQIGGTAIWLLALAIFVSGLGLYLKNGKPNSSSSILDHGTPVWMSIPVLLAGGVGIGAARCRTFALFASFLACSALSCCAGLVSSILVGIQLASDREALGCKNVGCPYSSTDILMLLLIGLNILQTALSLSGIIDGSILLYKDRAKPRPQRETKANRTSA